MAEKETKIGASFELDISNLQKGLKEAKQSISLTTSEFQKSTAGMNSWQKTAVGLSAKISELNTNLETQDEVVKNVRKQYELTKEQYGENSQEAQKLLTQLNKEEATYNKIEKQLKNYTDKLDKIRASEKSLSESIENTNEETKKTTEEFKKATKSMVDWRSNADGLNAKIKQLNTIITTQKSTVDALEKEYRDLINSQEYTEEEARTLQQEWKKQNSVLTELKRDVDQYEKELKELNKANKEVDDSTEKLGDGFTVFKGIISNLVSEGISKATSALKDFASTMISTAAEVKAQNSQFEQTFGDMGDEAEAAIKRVANSTGILDTRLKTVGSQIYAFARSSGATVPEAMELMETALASTADSAAYYDRSLEESAETLQSFLKGNYANDAALGVSATEFTRNAKAAELFGKKYNELSEIQKQQTLLKMVTDSQQLSGAMGQATRESDGFENVMGNLNETWRQFKAQVGTGFLEALIPVIKEITKGFKEWTKGVDWNAFGNKVKKAINAIVKQFQNFIKVLPKAINLVEKLLPIIVAIGTAILTYNTYMKAATVATKAYNAVTTLLKAGQMLLTGATVAQTAAQLGLNAAMAANPIGLIVTAVAALTVGLIALAKQQETEIEKTRKVTEEIKEQKQAYDDLIEAKQEDIDTGLTQLEYTNSLWKELQHITDEYGKIQDGYEARAKFIVGALSEALGIELEIIDGQVQKYGELENSIQDVINAKKAEIILSSQEELYTEAITKRQEALIQYNEKAEEIAKLEEERAKLEEKRAKTINNYKKTSLDWDIKDKTKEIEEVKKQYKTLEDLLEEYNYNIAAYETNATYVHNKEYDKVEARNWEMVKNYGDTTKEKIKELTKQLDAEKSNLELLKKNRTKYNTDTYNAMVASGEERIKALEYELEGYVSALENKTPEVVKKYNSLLKESLATITDKTVEFKDAGNNQVQAYIDGVAYKEPVALDKAESLANEIISELEMEKEAKDIGKDTAKGLADGIEQESKKESFLSKVKNVAKKVASTLSKYLQIASPSKLTKKYGKYLVQGLGIGIENEEDNLLKQVKSFAEDVTGSFRDNLDLGMSDIKASINSSMNTDSMDNQGSSVSGNSQVINFYQTNNSPKSLSRLEIYRQTNNALNRIKGGIN